jgi:tripartite-type tricarboxylate transporter receptor subunit TctC
MRKTLIAAVAALALSGGSAAAQTFPERELLGVIMWGAGGATDTVARAITPAAEEALGKTVVLLNKSGGAGAISTHYVKTAPADGYTLLYGAENPQIHGVMGVSELDYSSFYPVNILGRGVAVITVAADSKYQSFQELLDDVKANPGSVKMGSTGPGGLPSVVGALVKNVTDFDVIAVPFDGEGPGLTALQGGHVDFMPAGISAAAEAIKGGRLRALAVVDGGEVEQLPGVPPVTEALPDFEKFLPWGPFYGVFVPAEVPDDVKATLVEAYRTAAESEGFQTLMANRGNVVMNISGAEAEEFLKRWQATTAWVLQDTGAAKVSPEELGIARP